MPEEVKKEEVKEEKKKGPIGKLKEKVEDSEEHLAILSTFRKVLFSFLLLLLPSLLLQAWVTYKGNFI